MSLSREVRLQGKCKPVKCSRHFNQNGLVSDRIYGNNTVTSECNTSKCQGIFVVVLFFSFNSVAEIRFVCAGFYVLFTYTQSPRSWVSRLRVSHTCIFQLSITGWIPARLVLYFLSWSGFLVSFMMRNDINIALVSMVRSNNSNTEAILQSIVNASNNASDNKVPIAVDNGEFEWSSSVQSVILGSFYACYVLSQVSAPHQNGTYRIFHFQFALTSECSRVKKNPIQSHYNLRYS